MDFNKEFDVIVFEQLIYIIFNGKSSQFNINYKQSQISQLSYNSQSITIVTQISQLSLFVDSRIKDNISEISSWLTQPIINLQN